MTNATVLFHKLAFCFGLAAISAIAQDSPPVQPFHAVHLLWIDVQQPDAEKTVLAAIAGMNKAIVKAGCPDCVYHLWKVSGDPNGKYTYLQIFFWPGREVYNKVHDSPEYAAASRNWATLRSVVKEEVYNRYVEIQPDN
jgi:hypothetical protein